MAPQEPEDLSELVRRIRNRTAGDPITVGTAHIFVSVCGPMEAQSLRQLARAWRERESLFQANPNGDAPG